MVSSGLCIGCGGCVAQARPGQARLEWNKDGHLNPVGDRDWYRRPSEGLSACCPFSPRAMDEDEIARRRFPAAAAQDDHIGRFDAAYVGHAAEAGYRERGSSGGMASWVAGELLRRGMVDGVAHVTRSEEHTSELQSLTRTSYAVFCLKKKQHNTQNNAKNNTTHKINNNETIKLN